MHKEEVKMCSSCIFIEKLCNKRDSTEKKMVYYYRCKRSGMIIGPAWIACENRYKERKEEN